MSFGKSTTTSTPSLSPAQEAQVNAQNQFFTNTLAPTYTNAVNGATQLYNESAPGQLNAAQNLAGTANQAQNVFGSTGQSALQTGVSGLENIFSPNYESNQIAAALLPAQAQYQQNLANQNATYGGSGQLGSAREALADRQLAGLTQSQMAQTAAQVSSNIENQRLSAANSLAGIGSSGLTSAEQAAQNTLTAAGAPQQLYNQYASVIFGTPSAAYNLGPYGTTQGNINAGIKI
jgi:hypothetical protein